MIIACLKQLLVLIPMCSIVSPPSLKLYRTLTMILLECIYFRVYFCRQQGRVADGRDVAFFFFAVLDASLNSGAYLLIPCSLQQSPHALQTGSPSLLRRHSVVLRDPQFVQHWPCLRCADYRVPTDTRYRYMKKWIVISYLI